MSTAPRQSTTKTTPKATTKTTTKTDARKPRRWVIKAGQKDGNEARELVQAVQPFVRVAFDQSLVSLVPTIFQPTPLQHEFVDCA